MDYFAGLDISMDKTHVCVLDRDGVVVRESKTESTAEAIAGELAKAPTCHRIVFETGRVAPILFHGLNQRGLPVVCIESRQAYQALKSLATHETDRNDARGLAHLARTGFFKPVHVKSLSAHAVRSLIIARKKLVGQRVTLENQIRGLAVVFGVRLPRALTAAFIDNALRGDRRSLCGHARIDCGANCRDECGRRDRRRHKAHDKGLCSLPPADDHSRRRPTDRARFCRRNRRSVAHPPVPGRRRLFGLGSQAVSVWRGGLHRWHIEMRGQAGANAPVRGRQCHADPL
jgi:transposase